MIVSGKRVAVLGLGISGFAVAEFLNQKGAKVFVSESSDSPVLNERKKKLEAKGVEVELSQHSVSKILDSDFVVVSPGIKPSSQIIKNIAQAQVSIKSEIEVASWFFKGDIIAVTGTDGKTTVTNLLREILKGFGFNAVSCGNIGNPFVSELEGLNENSKVILELSSFQLHRTLSLKPKVAFLLNIAPDHLDWHVDFKDYFTSKLNVFKNQDLTDFAFLNKNINLTLKEAAQIKADCNFFNLKDCSFHENVQAALSICNVYDLNKEKAVRIALDFPGVEHRLERVLTKISRKFINDSKSTSIHSLEWALNSVEEKVCLICGGKNKGLDFLEVKELVKQKVKGVVLIGEAKDEIANDWDCVVPCFKEDTLEAAVNKAYKLTSLGETILFSPACASFDMFQNYIERGKKFKEIVLMLEEAGV